MTQKDNNNKLPIELTIYNIVNFIPSEIAWEAREKIEKKIGKKIVNKKKLWLK